MSHSDSIHSSIQEDIDYLDAHRDDDDFFDDFWNGAERHDIPMVEPDEIGTSQSEALNREDDSSSLVHLQPKGDSSAPPKKKGKRPPLHPKRAVPPPENPATGSLPSMTLVNGPLTTYLQEMRMLHATLSDNMNVVRSLIDSMFKVTSRCNTQQDYDVLRRSLEMIVVMSNNVAGRTTKLENTALSAKLEIQTTNLLNSVNLLLTKANEGISQPVKISSPPVSLKRTLRPSTSELGANIAKHSGSTVNSLPVETVLANRLSKRKRLYGSMAQQNPAKRPKPTPTLSVSTGEKDSMFSPRPTTRTPGSMAFNRPTEESSSKN